MEFYINPELLPAKHIKSARPRACAFCRFFMEDDGWGWCTRPSQKALPSSDLIFDLSEMEHYYTVCERWGEK